jgi:hypothetical protein
MNEPPGRDPHPSQAIDYALINVSYLGALVGIGVCCIVRETRSI